MHVKDFIGLDHNLQGRNKCKQVRHRDKEERYQLDVMPCDCQEAGDLEEELDEFPDDVISAKWTEHTDSNEADVDSSEVMDEESSEEYEFQNGNESEEGTDTTSEDEDDVSQIFEDNEESSESGDLQREGREVSYETEKSFETNDNSGAETSHENEGYESDEFYFTRNRRKRHRRRKTIVTSVAREEKASEKSEEEDNPSSRDVSHKESNESFETVEVTNEESNGSFETNSGESNSESVEYVTKRSEDSDEVMEQTSGPSMSNEDDITKMESSEEEDKTTEHVETVTTETEMGSDELDDMFDDTSSSDEDSREPRDFPVTLDVNPTTTPNPDDHSTEKSESAPRGLPGSQRGGGRTSIEMENDRSFVGRDLPNSFEDRGIANTLEERGISNSFEDRVPLSNSFGDRGISNFQGGNGNGGLGGW